MVNVYSFPYIDGGTETAPAGGFHAYLPMDVSPDT